MQQRILYRRLVGFMGVLLLLALTATPGHADGHITFHDLALDPNSGLNYRHARSDPKAPMKDQGAPGVALLDYNRDGALDIFVTNGPGGGNKLYKNLLKETGKLAFQDVAQQAGVALPGQDNTGVCYGDLNNDSYDDLLLLGNNAPAHLFLNNKDGTFTDITESSGLKSSGQAWSCAMGDVTGNGLLDIVIVKSHNGGQQNELWLNQGNNTFVEASKEAGLQNTLLAPGQGPSLPGLSLAVAMVDYDLDGKLDILVANDEAVLGPGAAQAYINVYHNDGTGHFTNVTRAVKLDKGGSWMGLSFGDLDGDGTLDLFATNLGDYLSALGGPGPNPNPNARQGRLTSRWFLGQSDGTFGDPGVGNLGNTSFGWGTAMLDYENTGVTDILFHGGPRPEIGNAPTLWKNDGQAHFTDDSSAFVDVSKRKPQNVQGLAVGDLANNGFVDAVWVSDFDLQVSAPFQKGLPLPSVTPLDGTLSVEMNSADNGNNWAQVQLVGSIGTLSDGKVNRDGIGAVVFFTPDGGKSAMQPILGGSSYASQDSLIASFGMGQAASGTVEVLWPGGVRNRLYEVKSGERVVFPEIPCSFKAQWASEDAYQSCVQTALDKLVEAKVLDGAFRTRFLNSALRAFTQP